MCKSVNLTKKTLKVRAANLLFIYTWWRRSNKNERMRKKRFLCWCCTNWLWAIYLVFTLPLHTNSLKCAPPPHTHTHPPQHLCTTQIIWITKGFMDKPLWLFVYISFCGWHRTVHALLFSFKDPLSHSHFNSNQLTNDELCFEFTLLPDLI